MSFFARHKRFIIISLLGSAIASPLLTSCGSSGGDITAGIGGTGITQGEITAFGSIFVNGIEFDTDNSLFEIDGDTSLGQNDLAVGMVVKIQGDIDSNGVTGTATSVEYDDKIQGPVTEVPTVVAGSGDSRKILSIFKKTVIIDETTTKFSGTSFDTISRDDIVEVSGFDTSTVINATFVKKTGDLVFGTSEVELKGTISNLSLSAQSFLLSGVTINYSNQTSIEISGATLENGLPVEVEGILQNPSLILADEIEEEDEDFENGDEISLQGVVADFVEITSNFTVGGQSVDASGASFSPLNAVLENGINIEVEGNIVDGVLIAAEVELREGSVEIKAVVSDVSNIANNRFTLSFEPELSGSIEINADNQTSFEDEVTTNPISAISQLLPGDFVKIEGLDTGTQIIANQVKRKNLDDIEVQGSVDSFVASTSITILGITFSVDGATVIPSPQPVAGNIVKITGENDPADGIVDMIELSD